MLLQSSMSYRGFVGSEGTRFPGQETTDINFTHWRNGAAQAAVRQRAFAVSQGFTFATVETRAFAQMVPGGPPVAVWLPTAAYLPNIRVTNYGPSAPNPMNFQLASHYNVMCMPSWGADFANIALARSIPNAAMHVVRERSNAFRLCCALVL